MVVHSARIPTEQMKNTLVKNKVNIATRRKGRTD